MLQAPVLEQSLGAKHRNLNAQANAILQQNVPIDQIILLPEDCDVDKLIKIDVIARSSENLPLIEKILCSDDMLLVSRAIKKSKWLANDPRITPHYLDTNLFPHMSSKAISKLLLSIRQNIKDEKKAEDFFLYFKSKDEMSLALKWLPMCSPGTMGKIIEESKIMFFPIETFKRIARTMPPVLNHFAHNHSLAYMQAASYLFRTNTDEYLNAIEKLGTLWKLNSRVTHFLLKYRFERIMNMIHFYIQSLHLPTFARRIGSEKILQFLVDLARNQKMSFWFTCKNLKPFILLLPKDIEESFFRCFFDESTSTTDDVLKIVQVCHKNLSDLRVIRNKQFHRWCLLAPFPLVTANVFADAFGNLVAPIENLTLLVDCCHNDQTNISALLDHFMEKHINNPDSLIFISNLIQKTHTHKYDSKTWASLSKIFEKLGVFTQVDFIESQSKEIANAIVVYNILRGQPIPGIISEKSDIYLHQKQYAKAKCFTEDERTIIFAYIYEKISDTVTFPNKDVMFIHMINLLNDWNKDLLDFPGTLCEIRERINCNDKLILLIEQLYKTNKRWRRILFPESFLLVAEENVCLNILKHDPNLITNYERLQVISRKDRLPVDKLLRKIRVYFKDDLLPYVLMVYKNSLTLCPEDHVGYQSVTRGFCILQDREQFRTDLNTYVPIDSQIKWLEIDMNINNIRKYLAGQMYLVRPTIDISTVMKFTGGDFLQYVVPSLLSIAYNMPKIELKEFVMKCLEGKISIKKLAVRVATMKLNAQDVDEMLTKIWETNKNYSLRAVLFQSLLDLIQSNKTKMQRDGVWMNTLWGTLKKYIKSLNFDEDRHIYLSLAKVNDMPREIRPEFCKISYEFLKRLPKKLNAAELYHTVFGSVQYYVENIDCNWMESVLLDYMKDLTSKKCGRFQVTAFENVAVAYILCSETEEIQMAKYTTFLKPYFDFLLETLNEETKRWTDNDYYYLLLGYLVSKAAENMRFGKHVIPFSLFKTLKAEMEDKYPIYETYAYVCYLNLTIAYFESYKNCQPQPKNTSCDFKPVVGPVNVGLGAQDFIGSQEFIKRSIEILNNDAFIYFASIYEDFAASLKRICLDVKINYLTIGKALHKDNDNFVHTMAALKLLMHNISTCNDFAQHQSLEVKLNYFAEITGSDFFTHLCGNNRCNMPGGYSLIERRVMEGGNVPRAIAESRSSKRWQRAEIRRWPKRRRLHMRE